jgi:hypothetical protein
MSNQPESPERWIMWAGGTPPLPPPPPRPAWIQAIAELPTGSVGELEECSLLSGSVPAGWRCAVNPDYILSHSCVMAVATPEGRDLMLFFQNHGPDIRQQPRPERSGQIGWFQVRLLEPIASREALDRNVANALRLLACAGHVP